MHSPLRHSDQQKKQQEDLGPFPCEIAIAWIPETCECSDEDDSYGMKTIRNVLDVNHDARWGFVDHLERGTEQLNTRTGVPYGGKCLRRIVGCAPGGTASE